MAIRAACFRVFSLGTLISEATIPAVAAVAAGVATAEPPPVIGCELAADISESEEEGFGAFLPRVYTDPDVDTDMTIEEHEEDAEEADEAEEEDVERRITFRGHGCAIQPVGLAYVFFLGAGAGAAGAEVDDTGVAVGGMTYVLRNTSSRCSVNTLLINSYASSICAISRAPVIIT